MLHINAPVLLKIREGINVNLSMTLSLAVEHDVPQKRIKEESKEKPAHTLTAKDYEEYGTADTVSFWFIGGTSLAYRVGHEITQEEFNRIKAHLQGLQYRTKDERKPSDNKASKKS